MYNIFAANNRNRGGRRNRSSPTNNSTNRPRQTGDERGQYVAIPLMPLGDSNREAGEEGEAGDGVNRRGVASEEALQDRRRRFYPDDHTANYDTSESDEGNGEGNSERQQAMRSMQTLTLLRFLQNVQQMQQARENNNNNNNPNPAQAGAGAAEGAPNTTPPVVDGIVSEREQARRQNILRLGMLLCLIFFLMDGGSSDSNNTNGNNDSYPGGNQKQNMNKDEINLLPQDLYDMRSMMLPWRYHASSTSAGHAAQSGAATGTSGEDPTHDSGNNVESLPVIVRQNMTGMYRGYWRNYYFDSKTTEKDYKTFFQDDAAHRSYHNISSTAASSIGGSLLLQTRTLPIKGLPDLSFVYGLVRLYRKNTQMLTEFSFPVQGVIVNAEQKVYVFPTPYKTDQFLVEITSTFSQPSATPPPVAPSNNQTEGNSVRRSLAHQHLSAHPHGHQHHNKRHHSRRLTSTVANSIHKDVKQNDDNTNDYSLSFTRTIPSTNGNEKAVKLKFFTYDIQHGLPSSNVTDTSTTIKRYFQLGESQLSARFKFLQGNRPTNSKTGLSFFDGIMYSPDCHRFLTFDLMHAKSPTSSSSQQLEDSNNAAIQQNKNSSSSDGIDVSDLFAEHVVPTNLVFGSVTSNNCMKAGNTSSTLYMGAVAYDLQADMLETKVMVYALVYTVISLVQIMLVIYQMKHASTPALNGKTSLMTLFSQSLLDAVICLGHLLIGAALPQVFFSYFIWIGILKLILFSVFQMRYIINVYQARYAQEIAAEGWRGFRSRLITLHLRFYAAVLAVILLAFLFPYAPIYAVILLYSFWWPQIIYSVYAGTKPAFHSLYVFGMTISRLFLPLYLLACPENFIYILWQYFSPGVEINIYRHTLNSLYGNHYLVANPEESSFSSTSNPIYSAGVFLVVWLGLQVIIMFAQAKLGSRFFVPKQFLPYRYDYHRPLPAQFRPVYSPASNSSTANGNAGVSGRFNGAESPNFITRTASWFGLTLRRSGSNSQNQHENTFGDIETGALLTQTQVDHGEEAVQQGPECVICYNAIHLNVSRDYMVTPCDHLFHEQCLTQWMHVKLECPVCRSQLPNNDDDDREA